MTKFLLLFVTLTCFACQGITSFIDAQLLLKCADAGLYRRIVMKNPESVGLEMCEMTQDKGVSAISIKNLKGDVFFCDVNFFRERGRYWDFSFEYNGQEFGDVVLQRKSGFVECITVYNLNNTTEASRDEAIDPAVKLGNYHW